MKWMNIKDNKDTRSEPFAVVIGDEGAKAVDEIYRAGGPKLAALVVLAILEAEARGYGLGRQDAKRAAAGCI